MTELLIVCVQATILLLMSLLDSDQAPARIVFPTVGARRHHQTISFIEISIQAGILLGGKHKACFVLELAGIEPMPS
jgi:hypothetical protein